MATKWKLIHIKSKQHGEDDNSPKLPTSDILEYGEIAINYGKDIETIAIRNENDEIIKFIPEHKVKEYVDKRINEALKEYVDKRINEALAEIKRKSPLGLENASIDSGEY